MTINRKDYGTNYSRVLDNGGALVGDKVAITLDIGLDHGLQRLIEIPDVPTRHPCVIDRTLSPVDDILSAV